MSKGIKRAALGLTLCFFILSGGLAYWQIIASAQLLAKPGNLRSVYLEQQIWRGGIFDRNGEILAKSYSPADAAKILGHPIEAAITRPGDNYPQQVVLFPQGDAFTHIVGTYSFIYGRSGLEASLNQILLGLGPGESVQSHAGQLLKTQRRGNDVVLTLDSKIQSAGVQAFKGKLGAAVAIAPKTGQILAMISSPTFDPNQLDNAYSTIAKTGNQVFVNKAISSLYPPGSVMKLVTSGGLLRSGLDVNALYDDTGHARVTQNGQSRDVVEIYKNGLGEINFFDALAKSSNTYFATRSALAGAEQFLAAAQRFGFGQRIPLSEFADSNNGVLPSSITKDGVPNALSLGQLMDSSYGQGQVQVTPLHEAMICAAVANNGVMMRPALVERVLNPAQQTIYRLQPKVWLTPLTPQEAGLIRQGMQDAVVHGTAQGLAISGVDLAAKTGTAEVGGPIKTTDGWFIAFAPAADPLIAVAVVVENGESGSGAAGPIARDMILAALRESR
ncbi:MAG: penicillin-binding transpeptidase domain-containing protein [Peptococcaceae bacterium]|nr:penicillin-binding transpeptidase domain-containing protein [Peptococcaceae bacterium]